jgi:hypothetical protein
VSSLCVSVQDAQTAQSLLKLADLARAAEQQLSIHEIAFQSDKTAILITMHDASIRVCSR